MRIRVVVLILIVLASVNCGYPQKYDSQQAEILTFNVLLNGVIGGIGGAINKSKEEKLHVVLAKNFLIGCLGGSVKYLAKYDAYNISYDHALGANQRFSWNAWMDRFLYYAGHSIVCNASLNKKPWESFQINLYGINFYYSITDSNHFQPKLSLYTLGALIKFGLDGNKFDLKNSLNYGIYYFDVNPKDHGFRCGIATYNVIALNESCQGTTNNVSHEFIHGFQFADYFPISLYAYKPLKNFKSQKLIKPIDRYVIFDIPYQYLFYVLQPKPWHYKNYYEYEARHFAIRAHVER